MVSSELTTVYIASNVEEAIGFLDVKNLCLVIIDSEISQQDNHMLLKAILDQRQTYEKNRCRRSTTFQDEGYICCSSYGRARSKDYHWKHYKKLLRDNNLPDIRWHDLRSSFCTLLLKNNFNPKAVSKLMGHAKELITMDVYGDNREIIADCVDELEPYIEEVLPNEEIEEGLDTETMEIVIPAELYLDSYEDKADHVLSHL